MVVDVINGKNNGNNGEYNYEWQSKSPIETMTYYRIKSVDNGIDSYSQTIAIIPPSEHKVVIYPNPLSISSEHPLTINGLYAGSNITITDSRGVICYKTIASGSSVTINVNRRMTEGIYIVTLRDYRKQFCKKLLVTQ